MAEGWTRYLKFDLFNAFSAGLSPQGINPLAVKAMIEAGVDISDHRSKHVHVFQKFELDIVVTVCGHANETCPVFPGKTRVLYVGFDDPQKLAEFSKTEEEALVHYRRVRDEIRSFIETFPEGLNG